MKRLLKLLICTVIIVNSCIIGCSNKKNVRNESNRKNIDFIVKMRSGSYWETVKEGADAAAKEFNINLNFTAPDYEVDVKEQIDLVNEAISRKTDGLVLAADDYNALVPAVERASSNKIPVIIADSGVNTGKFMAYIGTDNRKAGKAVAKEFINLVGENAKVLLISSVEGSRSAQQRKDGILAEIERHSGVEIVGIKYCLSSEKLAARITKSSILSYKKLDGIIALNSQAAVGAAEAVYQMNLNGKVRIVAFDSIEQEIQYMEKNVIQAVVVQRPFCIGYLSVKYAAMASRENSILQNIDTGFKIVDRNSIYKTENQRLIFPFVR